MRLTSRVNHQMAGRPRKNSELLPPPKTMGERLASERRRLGLTQEELADVLGVAASALRKHEQDRHPIKTTVLERMREAKINIDFVVFGRDRAASEPLDRALWDRVRAWDAANPNDADGKPLNDYERFQRITLFYRWLLDGPRNAGELDEQLHHFGQKTA